MSEREQRCAEWVEVDEGCPACGANPVEIFTAEADGNFWEGKEMRCTECGATGEWYENDHGFGMRLTTKWTLDALRAENEALKTENARMREALEDNCKQCSNVESNINSYHCCNSCLTYKALEGGE